MNTPIQRIRAFTLVELLVVLAVLFIIATLVLPSPRGGMVLAPRIQCVNNLKQTGLAFRIWEGDNGDRYPMAVPGTNGGAMDFLNGPNEFRTFQVMSNELSTPRVLSCPQETDKDRFLATNFDFFCNSNVSYFIGVDACETNPLMILSGDHNITDETLLKNGVLTLTTNRPARWTAEVHNKVGNICLADGSVQQENSAGLQGQIAETGVATNRLLMPILGR